jgi:hypothetical protein
MKINKIVVWAAHTTKLAQELQLMTTSFVVEIFSVNEVPSGPQSHIQPPRTCSVLNARFVNLVVAINFDVQWIVNINSISIFAA